MCKIPSPPLGCGLLQWLFQMRKPEAMAPVAVRQLMAVWLCPHCALFKSSQGCVTRPCSCERLQSSASITALIHTAFVLTWSSFITQLGSAHFNEPTMECTVEGLRAGGAQSCALVFFLFFLYRIYFTN